MAEKPGVNQKRCLITISLLTIVQYNLINMVAMYMESGKMIVETTLTYISI